MNVYIYLYQIKLEEKREKSELLVGGVCVDSGGVKEMRKGSWIAWGI